MLNLNCAVCSELLMHSDEVYITLCGHMFHHKCLIQWLESSKTCPQCRNKCTHSDIWRVYFNLANLDASRIDVGSLRTQFEHQMKGLKDTQEKCLKNMHGLEENLVGKDLAIGSYVSQIQDDANVINDLRTQNNTLNQLILTVKGASIILTESANADRLLEKESDPHVLANCVSILKQKLQQHVIKNTAFRMAAKVMENDFRKELGSLKEQLDNANSAIKIKEQEQNKVEQQIKDLKDTQLKCLKTILGLQQKLEGNDLAISNYVAQINDDKNVINDLRTDNNTLTQQIDTMKGVSDIVLADAKDADRCLKKVSNPHLLANWVSMLKQKLRQCEINNAAFGMQAKVMETDLRKELWSLQDQLDNANTAIKMKEQDHIKLEQQITNLNDMLDIKNFAISSYVSEIDLLKNHAQNNSFKQQVHTMEGVSAFFSANAEHADRFLKNEANPYVLANWVTVLREKLRECENKNTALRKKLKVMQHDLRKELDLKRKLEEQLSHSENDLGQAEKKSRAFKKPRLLGGTSDSDVLSTINPNFVDKDMGGSDKFDPFAQTRIKQEQVTI